ncbi:energy transducer TonB [Terracidiphilus sp.]|uniref:energy transducer TonB n=1 Tax=Terracidiphilus sp. TaxID=1964191 RepID=UPI003C256FC4
MNPVHSRRLRLWMLLAIATFFSFVPYLQKASAADEDPRILMRAAAAANSLLGPDVKPWHMKVSYVLADEKGAVTDRGTIEEFWIGSKRYKLVIAGSNYKRTVYGTDKGVLFSGVSGQVPALVGRLNHAFTDPLPTPEAVALYSYTPEQIKFNNVAFNCRVLHGQQATQGSSIATGLIYCFDPAKPVLRISESTTESTRVLYNTVASFQGKFIGSDLRISRSGKPAAVARLDTIEPLNAADTLSIAPTSDAVPPQTVNVSTAVAQGQLMHQANPQPPMEALQSGTVGTVTLEATIDTDGRVKILNGPLLLQPAAVEAVHSWEYRPYLLNGEPVQMHTTIRVEFDPY